MCVMRLPERGLPRDRASAACAGISPHLLVTLQLLAMLMLLATSQYLLMLLPVLLLQMGEVCGLTLIASASQLCLQ